MRVEEGDVECEQMLLPDDAVGRNVGLVRWLGLVSKEMTWLGVGASAAAGGTWFVGLGLGSKEVTWLGVGARARAERTYSQVVGAMARAAWS